MMRHFRIEELVSKAFHSRYGDRAWLALDSRALETLDALRDRYGRTTCNNWLWNGPRQYSGLRQPGDQHYNPISQHSFGRAFDCIFAEFTAEEVRADILKHTDLFPHIRGIELDVSWLHFDV